MASFIRLLLAREELATVVGAQSGSTRDVAFTCALLFIGERLLGPETQLSRHHSQASEGARETIKVDNNSFKATAAPTGFISSSLTSQLEREKKRCHTVSAIGN